MNLFPKFSAKFFSSKKLLNFFEPTPPLPKKLCNNFFIFEMFTDLRTTISPTGLKPAATAQRINAVLTTGSPTGPTEHRRTS